MVRREVGGAPSYDEVDYWEKRFTRVAIDKSAKQDGIEWLGKGDEIVKTIKEIANRTKYDHEEFGYILHLGAGVSDLSLSIGEVLINHQILLNRLVNIDFSPSALEIGRNRMIEWSTKSKHSLEQDEEMQFCCADLRDWTSLETSLAEKGLNINNSPFSILIDKSTCDSLATADNIDPTLTFTEVRKYPILNALLSLSLKSQSIIEIDKIHSIEAIDLVAFHLAALTQSGSVWIAMSYSEDRFKFLQTKEFCLSHPFWKIEQTKIISAPNGSSNPFSPNIFHHFTLLRRI